MSEIGATLRQLLRLQGARGAYLLEDTAGGYTPSLREGNRLVWTGAPTVSASGGPGGIGYASNSGSVEAMAEFAAHALGAAPRTAVCAFRTFDTDAVPWAFGTASTNADDAFAIDSATAISWLHTGNSAAATAALADNAWHTVGLRSSAAGAYRLQLDGTSLATGMLPSGVLATAAGALRLFRHPSSSTPRRFVGDLAFVALWDRELSDGELGVYHALLTDPHRLAGVAALADGSPASAVLIRRVTDHGHLRQLVPQAPSGVWEAIVPAGDYEVTCLGPDGYQPQTFAPVAAVPV